MAKDVAKPVDVRELLHRLSGEEIRCIERRGAVEPVPHLDSRDLSVQELAEDPDQQIPIAVDFEASFAEVERHLFSAE